jgi:ATP-dependent Clp protease protease subunit
MPEKSSVAELALTQERIITISEDFSSEMASNFAALLIAYANIDPEKEITVLIDSRGGDATAFILMHDIMKFFKTPIKTICIGKCYSAGALLLSCGTKGRRYALANSLIMIHGLQCLFPGEMDIEKSDKYFDLLEYYNDTVLSILARNTAKTLDQVKTDCANDYFMSATDAKRYGLIDHIVSDFNDIINLDSSVIVADIKDQIEMQAKLTADVKKKFNLECDVDCMSCPKNKECEDLPKVNEYLVQLQLKGFNPEEPPEEDSEEPETEEEQPTT